MILLLQGGYAGRPHPEQRYLYDIVNDKQSGCDVDRMDYLPRDAKHCGVRVYTFVCNCMLLRYRSSWMQQRNSVCCDRVVHSLCRITMAMSCGALASVDKYVCVCV